MHFLAECRSFLGEFRRSFTTTGSVLPSSRFLAQALASDLGPPRGPARILEVGPGTGPVTREILSRLRPDDRLDLVEINPRFVAVLRRRFDAEPPFARRRGQVTLTHAGVEQLPGEAVYDFIVSGLPLNNFPVEQVRQIFQTFDRLLKPGGTLAYFEYLLIRQLKTPFVGREERTRLHGVGEVVEGYIRKYQVRQQHVLMNVPPATVRHLCLKPAAATAGASSG